MKKYLGYIILIIILLISIVINIIFITKKNNKNEYNLYECSSVEKKDYYEIIKQNIIKYDNIGRVIFENIDYIEKFNNSQDYRKVKELRIKNKESNYEYIDREKSIINKYELNHSMDENNNEQFIWIKYIIDEYKKKGYTCEKITNEE